MNALSRLSLLCALAHAALSNAGVAHALLLNGAGTPTTLAGTLGTVDVMSLSDSPTMTGYLTLGGLVDPAPAIPIKRVQYDLLNRLGNGSIFEYRVDFPVGTNVIGAVNPGKFITAAGVMQNYWAGSNYGMVFDNGFGVYTYDLPFGSEWRIEYAADHVEWQHLGNGFFPDTATGRTDLGIAVPTFALLFDPATPLGLQPAQVTGHAVTGAPVIATGRVLSAVPEPQSAVIVACGAAALASQRRRRS